MNTHPTIVTRSGRLCINADSDIKLTAEYLYRVQRMMREDEKRPAIGAPENDVERTFRHIDPGDLLPAPL